LDNDKDSLDENKIKALMKNIEKYNNRELRRKYEAKVLKKYYVDNFIALQQKFKEL
jgi:CRISPR/Cas system-associated endonuclease Cas1